MDTPMTGAGPTGLTSSETTPMKTPSPSVGVCPQCGQALGNKGLEQFLGKLGISDEMINNLRSQMQNVDIDQYLNTARDYLKGSTEKAKTFTKENPGKVAAGVAVLAVGAGLLISALNRE
jgi:heterodisulfide reductase subunit A-like polyferredoxin